MRITISGSIKFAKQFVEAYHKLKELGHEPLMHDIMFKIADGSVDDIMAEVKKDHGAVKRRFNLMKWWHESIKSGDALLVLNYDKKGIKNYIGGNVLIEMAFAHVNDKKVFLLNPIPEDVPYVEEIKAMADVILNGDLKRIK